MLNFFIERPVFSSVIALLMVLIGTLAAFSLPIAQYPQVAPPQVQVTTTYTGADALSVARTVTTPIEQQINGTKGMIYYNSDSTSNGVSNIVATFDVGYSQDMAAVDIQNRVQTAQAQLPPEVAARGSDLEDAVASRPRLGQTQNAAVAAERARLELVARRAIFRGQSLACE